eukprot:gene4104-747_t
MAGRKVAAEVSRPATEGATVPRWAIVMGLLAAQVVLTYLIITHVRYTEIDWRAYMQEVEGYLHGERDYTQLRGETGPLVYPAGFLYVYSAFYNMFDQVPVPQVHQGVSLSRALGADVAAAQRVFGALFLVHMGLVYRHARTFALPNLPPKALQPPNMLYSKGSTMRWSMFLLGVSRRIYSIFVLRMFNDGLAMCLVYLAIDLFTMDLWTFGCVAFSLALSVKMNVLLMLPGLLLLLVRRKGLIRAVALIGVIVATQVGLAAPFITTKAHAAAYVSKAFETSRVFYHVWSVNLSFLPPGLFVSKASPLSSAQSTALHYLCSPSSIAHNQPTCLLMRAMQELADLLLFLTLATMTAFGWKRWSRGRGPLVLLDKPSDGPLPAAEIMSTLFECNFIGVVFARTLHYQFYSWYFHMVPFLLLDKKFGSGIRLRWSLAALVLIEGAFNIYPTNGIASLALQLCHLTILGNLFFRSWPAPHSHSHKPAFIPLEKLKKA